VRAYSRKVEFLRFSATFQPWTKNRENDTASWDLLPKHLEMKELPDGFAFRFSNDRVLFTGLSELATLERLCCPFLTITMELQFDQGPMWLKLTGEDGVKDFLRAELGI
jgi:hypothetical protein